MNITVVGAGNIGTQFSVHCAQKGHSITLYTSKPHLIEKELSIINSDGEVIHKGEINCATSDPKIAFSEASLIFVTVPAYCMKDIADKSIDYIKSNVMIGLVPGSGGGECAFSEHIKKGATVFGLQRVPSVARLVEYGKCVRAVGYRDALHVCALPQSMSKTCADIVADIFERECSPLPGWLNLTLTPSNQIIHTTRLRTLFNDYEPGRTYPEHYLMYEEWDNEASELMLKCDEELQKICSSLESYGFDLSSVTPLGKYYESSNEEELTRKIRSIDGFKGIYVPMLEFTPGKYIPDFNSRYFTADFQYGLSILLQISNFLGIHSENMKNTYMWYANIEKKYAAFNYTDCGIKTIDDFISFYNNK